MSAGVRARCLLLLAACGGAPASYPKITAPCAGDRIGTVTVSGASRAAVAQLAVLEGTLDDPSRTDRIATVALDGLRAQGYPHATLAVTRAAGCFVDLHVAVTLGPRYRIANIAFDTDDGFPARERLAVLEDALGTVNTVGGVYIEYRMLRGIAALERRYHDAGWVDAKVGTPRTDYQGDTLRITIPVTAGRRYRIGHIEAYGAGRAKQQVLDTLGLRAGDYYDGPAVRSAIERTRKALDRWIEVRTNVADDRPEIDLEAIVESM